LELFGEPVVVFASPFCSAIRNFCKKIVEATLQAKLELLKCNLSNLKRMTGDGRKDASPRNNVHGMRAIVERRMQTTF
jgi:hypothetical protein